MARSVDDLLAAARDGDAEAFGELDVLLSHGAPWPSAWVDVPWEPDAVDVPLPQGSGHG